MGGFLLIFFLFNLLHHQTANLDADSFHGCVGRLATATKVSYGDGLGWSEAKPAAVAVWHLWGGFRLPPTGLRFASEVGGKGRVVGIAAQLEVFLVYGVGFGGGAEVLRGPIAVRVAAVDTSKARNAN